MAVNIQKNKYNRLNERQLFINECEIRFDMDLHKIGDTVAKDLESKIVTLSGPSCSGKTTTADNLVRDVTRAGRTITTISIDDFFLNRDVLDEIGRKNGTLPDYESINSIDVELFEKCVNDIYDRKKVRVPVFDFVSGTRTDYREFNASDFDVVMFEGIQANYPEIVRMLCRCPYISVSTNVRNSLRIGEVDFSPREIRLARRIVRDIRKRGCNAEKTLTLWQGVVANEDKNIIPYESAAKLHMDSLMGYDMHILKNPLLSALSEISPDSEYYSVREKFERKLENIEAIGTGYIPKGSMYWEFLG